ncbi:universal stress protein [Paraburkholderia strydomiana]|uniref:universal stress protein n=1 Tax=Paraburkholderia strydomiana TaxID=1245417 RepID=UPI002034C721|nr:universal stress protein [Paraburkholderia strydomiana]
MHSSIHRILLVYDATDESHAALLRCSQLSVELSAQVDVVLVVDLVSSTARSAGTLNDLVYSHLEEAARHTLWAAVDQLADKGVTAQGHLTFGRTVDAILRQVAVLNSHIVVVGHRTRKGLSRWLGGRPMHLVLAKRLRESTLVTVTLP